jgi:hypothetical protein
MIFYSWNTFLNIQNSICHNPSLGLATKARTCEGAGQEWSPGVTFHAPKNVGECGRVWRNEPSQIGNLTPGLSFGYNLRFKYPNGSCEPILDIYVLEDF